MALLILASQSPRRQELLSLLGLKFQVIPSSYQEDDDPKERNHVKMAASHARGKALQVREGSMSTSLVLAADTIVVLGEKRMGKPASSLEARLMLEALSGHTHQVITAICLVDKGNQLHQDHKITNVTFRKLAKHEIIKYVETNDPMDKAGGYGIQSSAACFVSSIEGCYFNVMGLPVSALTLMLRKAGIDCPDWNNLGGHDG
jgi:septum formation protein